MSYVKDFSERDAAINENNILKKDNSDLYNQNQGLANQAYEREVSDARTHISDVVMNGTMEEAGSLLNDVLKNSNIMSQEEAGSLIQSRLMQEEKAKTGFSEYPTGSDGNYTGLAYPGSSNVG